jgi:hypothetical protein
MLWFEKADTDTWSACCEAASMDSPPVNVYMNEAGATIID